MTAKHSDLRPIQEIYDVVTQTQRQMRELEFSKAPVSRTREHRGRLIAEGLINRVLRVGGRSRSHRRRYC